jgi:NADH:ubiquinone oxidoreductase subunit K
MGGLTLIHFLVLGALLFATGVLAVTVRRNAVGVLIGIELMLNACNVNLVAISRFTGSIDGVVYAIFVVMLAAAEAAVALAIVLHVFHHAASISVDDYTEMKG